MKRILVICAIGLMLSGCTALPAEERSFAVALGVEGGQGAWQVHARIPTYQTGGGYATVTGEGDSLSAALAALDAASPMQLHLGQLRLLVFSADLARGKEFALALEEITARHDLRMEAKPAITEADMKSLMDALKPATGARLSKSLDVLMETRDEQGTVIAAPLSEILLMGERQSPALLNISLDGQEASLSGCWPIGTDGKAQGPLSPEETQLLSLMLGRMKTGTLSLAEGTIRITSAKAEVSLEGPTLQNAAVRLMLRCNASSLSDAAVSQAAATACLGVLNKLSGMGSDALGLGRQALRHAQDMAQWHDMNWPQRYREIEWSVSVGAQPAA